MSASALTPLWLSLRSASLAVAIVAPLGLACAIGVRRLRGRRRSIADLLLLSPLVLPPTVLGFLLLQLLGRHGLIGSLLARFGIEILFSWPATVLSAALVALPLMYRSALAALEQVDPALPQVARSLGAGEARLLMQVLLPLALPGLMAGLSLSFARALGEFGTTLMLAGNIPGRTQTLPLAIYAAVDSGQSGEAWLFTLLVLILSGLSLLLIQGLGRCRRRRRRHAAGGTDRPDPPGRPEAGQQQRRRTGPYRLELTVQRQLQGMQLDLRFATRCRRLGILGASGAGKSQLLRCLAGLDRPDSGRICLNGRVLFDQRLGIDRPLRQRRLGLVFQNYALFPHLSVAANVGFGLQHLPPADRRLRVATLLQQVGLAGMADRYPDELSGGQQQRVALIRALAIEPDVLLLDEPFSAQDGRRRRQLQEQLADLLRHCQVPTLLVSHDLGEAYRLSDELLVIDQGRILAHGPKQELIHRPGDPVVARLSGVRNLSRLEPRAGSRLWASDWHLELELDEMPAVPFSHVGVRADQLQLTPEAGDGDLGPDQWRVRLVRSSEGPFHVTASVTAVPEPPADAAAAAPPALIEVDLPLLNWQQLVDQPQPWRLTLPRQRLLWLRQNGAADQS